MQGRCIPTWGPRLVSSSGMAWASPPRLPPPPLILQSFKNRDSFYLTFPLLGAVSILREPTKLVSCAPRLGSLTGPLQSQESPSPGGGDGGPWLASPGPPRACWQTEARLVPGLRAPRMNQKSQAASQPPPAKWEGR